MDSNNNQWKLVHGCWRGTITSRDVSSPEYFDTRQDAFTALEDHRKFYRRIEYSIWFARLTSPDGNEERLRYHQYKVVERRFYSCQSFVTNLPKLEG